LHLSRAADTADISVLSATPTAVVVHPPPEISSNDGSAPNVPSSINHSGDASERSSFSLFGLLTRWNKESDDSMRLQEFQEQVDCFCRECLFVFELLISVVCLFLDVHSNPACRLGN
jgi:hypothetical protein